jgi:serine/threonine-protein kinase RsbW
MPQNARFTLTLPSDSRMLSVARSFVEGICQSNELDRRVTFAVVMCTAEAVSNIIRHAHRDRSGAMIQIRCRLDADMLELQFLDEGEPFDISAVPHLDPGEVRLGGRGVFLMRSMMDELTCQPRPGRGNILRMVKRRSPESAIRDVG